MFRNIFTYHTHTHTHHRGCIKRINRLRINVDRNEIQEGGAYVKRLQYCISSPWNKDKLHLVYDFARECVVSARSNSIWNEKKKKNFCFAVDMYLQFACCAAVPGGGRNKEYALHLLHMCKGNIHVRYFHFNFFIPFHSTLQSVNDLIFLSFLRYNF